MGDPSLSGAAIGTWVFLFLIGFLIALAISVAIRKRPGWGAVMAVLVFVVAGLVYYIAGRGGHMAPPVQPTPTWVGLEHQTRSVPLIVEKAEAAAHRIEAPDDLKAWARDGILGFRPACPWLREAESGRTERLVGDTEFLYWEPVNGRLHGFSEQEAEREAAYRGARRSAERKLAVLALVVLKQDDRRADAVSAEPLAFRLAKEHLHEDARHLEKAKRPYGEVYRAAVAARAGSAEVSGLAAAVRQELARGWVKKQRAMTSWLLAIGASLIAGFAIFLFYTFANAGTKGYFAWPLRVASLALFVLLCAGLFYLRVRLGAG